MKQQDANKPYNPADDPYYVPVTHIYGGFYSSTGKAIVFILVVGGFAAVKKLGWIGLIGLVAAALLTVIVWLLLRKSLIQSAAEPGHINRHNQVTRECITPLEKKYAQRFYKVECLNCGKSGNVQASRIRSYRCPYCRVKKGGSRDGR